jgi:ParB-like chromosome segregation protein Spo0J
VVEPVAESTPAAPKQKRTRRPKVGATDAKAGPVVLLLECRKISAPKADKGLRTFNKEFAGNLAGSIKVEGLYNPIVVRPDPQRAGYYIIVQGKHRLYAVKIVLHERFIAATVIADMDEAKAEFATITENLWRNPLTKGQQTLSIKRWFEYYQAKFASPVAKAADGEATADNLSAVSEAAAGPIDSGDVDVRKKIPGFTEKLTASMGGSKRQAERALRLAKAFDEEQLQVLDQEKVTNEAREQIAKVNDEADRGAIVNLVASGRDAVEAIAQVMKDKAPAPVNAKAKEAAAAKKAAVVEKAPAMIDDEWYTTYCGAKAAMLSDTTKYKADALYYRKIVDERAAYRAKIKKVTKEARDTKVIGPFLSTANRHISFTHPKDWAICGGCGGKGVDPADPTKECPTCRGACYQLKTETYL